MRLIRIGASARRWRTGVPVGGLLLLTALPLVVYWPVLHDFFALDDFIWLSEARTHDARLFFHRAFAFPPDGTREIYTPFWRPLVDAYFFVAWRLFGLDPLPYRLTNIILHGAVGALTALLARQVLRSWRAGIAAGGLFILFPAYDFAVAWISDITELLGAFWYLLAIACYTAYLQRRARRRPMYLAALGALMFGLLTKESTVTLPAVLLLLTVALDPPTSRRQGWLRLRMLMPFITTATLYALFLYWWEVRPSAATGLYRLDRHALAHLWDYVQRLSLPMRDTDPATTPFRHGLALVFLASGPLALVLRQRLMVVAWLWTMLALLPYSFLVAGIEYRYTYLAAVPFILYWVAGGQAALYLLGRLNRRRLFTAGVVMVLVLLGLLLGRETQRRQRWLSGQSRAYAQVFHEVPAHCGPLAPGSEIYLFEDHVWDYYGVSTGVALSFHYQAVQVYRGPAAAERVLTTRAPHCALRYTDGRYARYVEP